MIESEILLPPLVFCYCVIDDIALVLNVLIIEELLIIDVV